MHPSPEKQREMLRLMQTIRRFEERATKDYIAGDIYGVVHSYVGGRPSRLAFAPPWRKAIKSSAPIAAMVIVLQKALTSTE